MAWSTGFRFLIVGLLALLMFIPLFFAGEIVDGRAGYSRQTRESVGREWGGRQVLNGPQMIVPVVAHIEQDQRKELVDPETGLVQRDPETGEVLYRIETVTRQETRAPLYVYPQDLAAAVSTQTQIRRRGLFEAPVYNGQAQLSFTFDLSGVAQALHSDEQAVWSDAHLRLELSSNRGLRGATQLRLGGGDIPLEPAGDTRNGAIVAQLTDPQSTGQYVLQLGLNGAQELFIAPVGRHTRIDLTSDWPHPSFAGAFLPDMSEITQNGFQAKWTIPIWPVQSRKSPAKITRPPPKGRPWACGFINPMTFTKRHIARRGMGFCSLG
jgi:inner membrane protein